MKTTFQRSTLFYDSWEIDKLAEQANLRLLEKRKFEKDVFKGYEEVRTNPAAREASDTSTAFTHIYQIRAWF